MEVSEQEINLPTVLHEAEVATFRSPETVIKEAEMVAKAFKPKADELKLYKKIGPSKHLLIEGWQLIASMYRVTAGTVSSSFVTYGDAHGFEATAEAIHIASGRVISRADGMCLDDEENWSAVPKYELRDDPDNPGDRKKVAVGYRNKPLQQLRSMAQTRALAKALSNIFKPIAKMAGFETTPGEEMTGDEYDPSPQQQQPQRKSTGRISDPQRKRLWAIGKNSGKSNEQMTSILKAFGFAKSDEVTSDKYDEVCAAVQKPEESNGQSGE